MLRWLSALVAGGIVSGFTFLLLTGDYINDGTVVVAVTESRGVHAGDLFVPAGWAVVMAALGFLIRRRGPLGPWARPGMPVCQARHARSWRYSRVRPAHTV